MMSRDAREVMRLASAMGTNVVMGTLYQYFDGKDALLDAFDGVLGA